ncbi:MAG: hypothetical protein HY986_09105 [Candidatus Melainabacteria bacterium]|nr:hypothetical protein [Candidatus Melainabacteria bacterium]
MSKLESAYIKSSCTVLSIALVCAVLAAERLSRMPVRVVGLPPRHQALQKLDSQAQPQEPERAVFMRECPEHSDVLASIAGERDLLRETAAALEQSRGQEYSLRLAALEGKLSSWQEQNQQLMGNCDLLLGASGNSVFPEIPLSLENLTMGGDWLKMAMEAQKNGRLRESRLYIKAAKQALNQAEKVLAKKVRLNRRSALIKPPHYLKSIAN